MLSRSEHVQTTFFEAPLSDLLHSFPLQLSISTKAIIALHLTNFILLGRWLISVFQVTHPFAYAIQPGLRKLEPGYFAAPAS